MCPRKECARAISLAHVLRANRYKYRFKLCEQDYRTGLAPACLSAYTSALATFEDIGKCGSTDYGRQTVCGGRTIGA